MNHLINSEAQAQIATLIDHAVGQVLAELASHGGEEGLTSALGNALMGRSLQTQDLRVDIKYRQHNRITEEPHSGADGGFLVRVATPHGSVEKVALFQAKLLGGLGDVRALRMPKSEGVRLMKQATDMLKHTGEAVAMFYTWKNIYVVDAADYRATKTSSSQTPLSQEHRLITLGTYLGRWMPRCTKGDQRPNFVTRCRHMDGFKHGLTLDIVSKRPAVAWEADAGEDAWRQRGRKRAQ